MPKRKKKDIELTKDEAMKKLFPKVIRDKLYEIAHEKDKKE
jgi:hypothetical protein